MQDIRAPKRIGLKEIVSHACNIVREDMDAYKEAKGSLERDRWV